MSMKVEKQIDAELVRVIEAGAAAILDPELAPQRRTEAAFRYATSWPVHESKTAAAIAMINEHKDAVVDALRRCDYFALARLTAEFTSKYRFAGLSTALVEQTERDRSRPVLRKWGWHGEEEDAAFLHVKASEKIESVSWDHFVVAGRRLDREKVRLSLKPRYSNLSDAEWLAKFPRMRRAKLDKGEIVFESA